ncbi:MAG: glycine cleavage system protein GcvH [Gemmatimonadota bacterium]|nr:MAG: glycine cleavage system protein GcvH [Gemmatimonadota bacterium]
MDIQEDFLYTKEHEWIAFEEDIATVGITDYAQSELGDIVFIELPEVGSEVRQTEPFGTIEAVKAVSDLYAPLSGEVIEVNTSLEDEPEQINSDPYGNGWMIKIKVRDESELEDLLSAGQYKDLIGG